MSESTLIERVLQEILKEDIQDLSQCTIRWEDEVIISLQWSLKRGQSGSAKVLKLEGDGWKILNLNSGKEL